MLGRVIISAIVQRQSQYAGQMRTIQRAIVVKTMIAPMSVARAVVDIGLHHASRKTDPTISAAMTATIPSARRLQAGVTWLRAVVPQPRNRGRPSGRLLACPAGPARPYFTLQRGTHDHVQGGRGDDAAEDDDCHRLLNFLAQLASASRRGSGWCACNLHTSPARERVRGSRDDLVGGLQPADDLDGGAIIPPDRHGNEVCLAVPHHSDPQSLASEEQRVRGNGDGRDLPRKLEMNEDVGPG